jgi:protein-S-isoprenylcysteine O-methyltransferase Ste14
MSWSRIARRIRVPLGFALALAYVALAQATRGSLLAGICLAAAGLWVRAAASGHVRKNETLATSGPYAYTRNPLYLGSMMMATGFAIAARNWWIAVLLVAMFTLVYWPVIRSEEAFLRERFPEYPEYERRVPRLLPRLRAPEDTGGHFSWALYRQHREYNASIGAAVMLAVLVAKMLWWRG